LFQLIATNQNGQQAVEARKIAALDKPSALAFGPHGELYVTEFGTAADDNSAPPGRLLRIPMGL
jgi:hypothetical protein